MSDLVALVNGLATQMGTDLAAANGNISQLQSYQGDLSTLSTAEKSSIVAALNAVKSQVDGIDVSAVINDSANDNATTWSGIKILGEIQTKVDTAVAGILGGAPAALDTLKELADALQSNPSVIESLLAVQAKSVRVDTAQTFTGPEQTQARANIGAAAAADVSALDSKVGDVAGANFVTTYNNAKSA